MSNENNMSRRKVLKTMGVFAASTALSASELTAADSLNLKSDKKMKVVAINGSSRKDGNTADMLNLVLGEIKKEGHETELIQLAGHTIDPCKACFACAEKGNCVFDNDIFRKLYTKMTEADAIVLGSSTYSADVSSTLKAVIERASVVSDTNPGMFRHSGSGTACRSNEHHRHNQSFLSKQGNVSCRLYLLEHCLRSPARRSSKR